LLELIEVEHVFLIDLFVLRFLRLDELLDSCGFKIELLKPLLEAEEALG